MDGMLSQEEINALLNEGGSAVQEDLNDVEKDAIGEISNICMGTAATALSQLVNVKVDITTPTVSIISMQELSAQYGRPCVFIQISYKEGLEGSNVLILVEDDVKVITDLMMGGDGSNVADELSELHLSAISEAMNQMMGSASTSLSSMLERKVDISPPVASLIDLNDTVDLELDFLKGEFVVVSFKMEIGDLVDSQIMQLYPLDLAKELYNKLSGGQAETASAAQPVQQTTEQQPSMEQQAIPQQPMMEQQATPQQPMMGQQAMPQQPMMGQQAMPQQPMMGQPVYMMPTPDVNIQPAQFQAFMPTASPAVQQENIDLIMDVPLEVTVELGRTTKSIKEILDFTPGTIIELNKLAGEPIDVLVNGKFVAKGEVVVIEENFGIRVTEIIK